MALKVNLLPDLSYPTLTVRTEYTGAAPSEIETLISEPVEEAVGVVKNLRKLKSVSRTGQSDVVLEFAWGTDMDQASLEVRDKMEVLQLPLEAKAPVLLRFNPSTEPIMRLALSAKADGKTAADSIRQLTELRRYADEDLKKKLEPVDGVAAVKVGGGLEDEIQVDIDQQKLAQLNLPIDTVIQRLQQENINISGGRLEEGSPALPGAYRQPVRHGRGNPQHAGHHPEWWQQRGGQRGPADGGHSRFHRRCGGDGRSGVCAECFVFQFQRRRWRHAGPAQGHRRSPPGLQGTRRHHPPRAGAKRWNWRSTRKATPTPSSTADAVKKTLEQIKATVPPDVELTTIDDQSTFIQHAISDVELDALIGGMLAILIIFLFLRDGWSTFIVALSLPISIIATFFFMDQLGLSLNVMSLGGLALATGMVVDDSIVVLESIAKAQGPRIGVLQAAITGTREVSMAVVASTLTTVAVFLPLVFVQGIAGQLFRDQALTVAFAIAVSLVVSMTLIPMLSALKGRPPHGLSGRSAASAMEAAFALAEAIGGHRTRGRCWRARFLLRRRVVVRARVAWTRFRDRSGNALAQRQGHGTLRWRRAQLHEAVARCAGQALAGAGHGCNRIRSDPDDDPDAGRGSDPATGPGPFRNDGEVAAGHAAQPDRQRGSRSAAGAFQGRRHPHDVRSKRYGYAARCQSDRERRKHRQDHRGDGRRWKQ